MKWITPLFLFAMTFFLFSGCSDDTDIHGLDTNDMIEARGAEVWVTVPFKVEYTGEYLFQGINPDACGASFVDPDADPEDLVPIVNVVVEGWGQGTHVGNSTIHFDFCGVPGPDGFQYGDPYPVDAYIVAANGDMLYLTVSGLVIPGRTEDHPEYVTSYWRDPFQILGGTGRFEDATGEGYTDDYNSNLDPYSHHDWDGTITMKKGKPN